MGVGPLTGGFDNGGLAVLWFGWFLGFLRSKVWVDFQRTVPISGRPKQVGHIAEVHDREVGLTLLLPQPGTPAMICLNSVMEPIILSSTISLTILQSGSGGEQL